MAQPKHQGLDTLITHLPVLRNQQTAIKLDLCRDLIFVARQQGKTYPEIADILSIAAIKVSPETIRRYVNKHTKALSEQISKNIK